VDLVWLLGIAKNLYRDEMGDLMASEPKLIAGLAFYLLYALGVITFCYCTGTIKTIAFACIVVWRFIWLVLLYDL
jgi:uncharacterized membrane protein